MGGILGAILSAVVSALLPVIINLIKSHLPQPTSRAQARQWVVDALNEFINDFNAQHPLPAWITALESPAEAIFSQLIDAALDKAGL